MSYEQDSSRTDTFEYQAYHTTLSVAEDHHAQVVKRRAQHTSGQTESEQTDITERVADEACSHVIGVPQTCADVNKRIAARRIEDIDTQRRDSRDDDQRDLGDVLRQLEQHAECNGDDRTDDEQGPTPLREVILKARLTRVTKRLHDHRKAYMEYTDSEG